MQKIVAGKRGEFHTWPVTNKKLTLECEHMPNTLYDILLMMVCPNVKTIKSITFYGGRPQIIQEI